MTLRLQDYVRVYDGALPQALCDEMVQAFDGFNGGGLGRREPTVSFDEFVIDGRAEWTSYVLSLEAAKDRYFQQYARECPGRFPARWDFEAFRLKRYRASRSDQFGEHVDSYNLTSSKRFLVCFWYLNDVEQGGETSFPLLRLKVRPKAGRLIMFPPYWMFEHTGCPVTSSDKFIVSTYLVFSQ